MRQAAGTFVIPLATLVEGVNHLRLEGSGEEVGISPEDAELVGPIVLEGDFVRSDNHVEVQARIATAVHLVCGRCVADIEAGIDVPMRLFCERQGKRQQKRPEATVRDEEGLMVYDGQILDLREEVRQTVLLEVPWHPLCRKDCKGLCLICGKDRNLDECGCERRDAPGSESRFNERSEEEGRPSDAS